MRPSLVLTAAAVLCAGLVPVSLRAGGGQAPAGAAVYTAAQADLGRSTFRAQCAACHGRDLSGSEAPPLAGSGFFSAWKSQSTQYLFKYVQEMPPGGPYLSPDQYLGVVAFILQQNGALAGSQPLTAATDVPIGTVATGQRPEP
jgi:mono/diheme cytochrome c family protein